MDGQQNKSWSCCRLIYSCFKKQPKIYNILIIKTMAIFHHVPALRPHLHGDVFSFRVSNAPTPLLSDDSLLVYLEATLLVPHGFNGRAAGSEGRKSVIISRIMLSCRISARMYFLCSVAFRVMTISKSIMAWCVTAEMSR